MSVTELTAGTPLRTRGRRIVALVLCLAGIAILVALGTWQVERLNWKEGVIARVQARIHAAPVEIDAVETRLAETGDVDYVPARAAGRFLYEGERYFLSTFDGQAGWNVFTPLSMDDGTVLFVNRGFVPYELRDPARRPEGAVPGRVEVTGLARSPQSDPGGAFMPANDPARNTFFWRDVPGMAQGLQLPVGSRVLPFTLDAGAGRAPGGWPVGGTTVIDIPNNHLQYAITWYGLALALAGMMVAVFLKARAPAAPPKA